MLGREIPGVIGFSIIISLASAVGFKPALQRYVASQKPTTLQTEQSGCQNISSKARQLENVRKTLLSDILKINKN